MLGPWPVTAADYVEREMLRIHSHQNGIWLSCNEEERFDAVELLTLTRIGGQPLRAQSMPTGPRRLASISLRFPIKDGR